MLYQLYAHSATVYDTEALHDLLIELKQTGQLIWTTGKRMATHPWLRAHTDMHIFYRSRLPKLGIPVNYIGGLKL